MGKLLSHARPHGNTSQRRQRGWPGIHPNPFFLLTHTLNHISQHPWMRGALYPTTSCQWILTRSNKEQGCIGFIGRAEPLGRGYGLRRGGPRAGALNALTSRDLAEKRSQRRRLTMMTDEHEEYLSFIKKKCLTQLYVFAVFKRQIALQGSS